MTTAIIACVKQEERYIREWLDWHLMLGFDHFFLADNNDKEYTPSLSSVIEDYADEVTIIDCHDITPIQPICYNMIMDKYGNDYDWYAMIDVDEFFWLKSGDIKTFLSNPKLNKADIVYFHWLIYGDSGNVYYEDRHVQERFTQPWGKNGYIKSMFRKKSVIERHTNKEFTVTDQHYVLLDNNLIRKDCLGNMAIGYNGDYYVFCRDEEFDVAYIKHYITKSLEEYLYNKRLRGDTLQGRCKDDNYKYDIGFYFKYNEYTEDKFNYLKHYE